MKKKPRVLEPVLKSSFLEVVCQAHEAGVVRMAGKRMPFFNIANNN